MVCAFSFKSTDVVVDTLKMCTVDVGVFFVVESYIWTINDPSDKYVYAVDSKAANVYTLYWELVWTISPRTIVEFVFFLFEIDWKRYRYP